MKPLVAACLLLVACRAPSANPTALSEPLAESQGSARKDDVIVSAKLLEHEHEQYQLVVEIDREGQSGARERLTTPRVLLMSGNSAEMHVGGEGLEEGITLRATLPREGDIAAGALIEVSMSADGESTPGPRLLLPMPDARAESTPAPPVAPRTVSVAFEKEDVRSVLADIARQAGVNVVAAPEVRGEVTLAAHGVSWFRALELALEPLALSATQDGDLLRVERAPTVARYCQVWVDFRDEDFARIVETIAADAGVNVVSSAELVGTCTLRAEGVSWLTVLEAAAESVGCHVLVSHDESLVRVVAGDGQHQ